MSDAALLGLHGDGTELISLRGIAARGFHGVFPEEKRDGQTFVVDLVLALDRTSAADDVTTTVDYGVLAAEVAGLVEGDPVDLIETLARRIADAVLADPLVSGVVVTVHKPEAPMPVSVADAAVTVVKARR